MEHVFDRCHSINELLSSGRETDARNELIKVLADVEQEGLVYSPLINALIRNVGLFPYLDPGTSAWQDRYVYEVFKADVGEDEPVTLHREQSRLLNALLAGHSVAVSAPTSFGKSFVIDSFIAIKEPSTVVILVPTIALADETRRRLQRKFGHIYKLITTPDRSLGGKNILVFPQERAIGYVDALSEIDILVVDEFYKASKAFDKDRAPALMRAIIRLGRKAKQRYFLAPNITSLPENPFTKGMEFLRLDFNTVFLEKNELYEEIGRDEQKKGETLLRILATNDGKTLIYAGTYPNIRRIANLLMGAFAPREERRLHQFKAWLAENYDANWDLTSLVIRGVGIHNGQMHRSLSQLQIRLFEEEGALDQLISTSSIIEGVNTSARNVVVWSNKNGKAKFNDFTYKNIIGRGGRMFRHFVGRIFVLEPPPPEENTQLELGLPDELLGTLETGDLPIDYTDEQIESARQYEAEMRALVGSDNFDYFKKNDVFQTSNGTLIVNIAKDVRQNPDAWNGLGYLNSLDPRHWDRLLYRILALNPGAWEIQWTKYVEFVKVLSANWERSIPELLDDLSKYDIGLDDFFKLERITTFKLASLLGDVNQIYNRMRPESQVDLGPVVSRISHAFLPPVVFQLEEYGLPRMTSRKIHRAGVIDLAASDANIDDTIDEFRKLGYEGVLKAVGDLDAFEEYILDYFYQGIAQRKPQ